jgi:hypothetical protein
MLHSYQAELNGSQLIWIDQPPASVERRRVLVVLEEAAHMPTTQPSSAPIDAYTAFMRAQGCLGKASREQIDAELAALRDEWDRPLGV